jgi:hypothetical protein
MNLKDIIKQLAEGQPIFSYPCIVKSVNGNKCDVEPVNGDSEIFDVRLQGEDTNNGILMIPKVGSVVIVSMVDKDSGFVTMYSEVEEIHLRGESLGGLVKIEDLVDKINNIENKVNDLISGLQGVVIPLAASGTYALVADFGSVAPLQNTEVSDIENDKVKHG